MFGVVHWNLGVADTKITLVTWKALGMITKVQVQKKRVFCHEPNSPTDFKTSYNSRREPSLDSGISCLKWNNYFSWFMLQFKKFRLSFPRFNTVSFGKHSLRYLGPILWSKLDKNDKTCKSLSDFRNRMRNKDLTSFIDDRCKGCLLCDSWYFIGNNFSILVLSFSILANNL